MMSLLLILSLMGCSSDANLTIEQFCEKSFFSIDLRKACISGVKISDRGFYGVAYAKKNCDMYLRHENGSAKAKACFSGYKAHERRKARASIQPENINDSAIATVEIDASHSFDQAEASSSSTIGM